MWDRLNIWDFVCGTMSRATVLPAKSDSGVMFCLYTSDLSIRVSSSGVYYSQCFI